MSINNNMDSLNGREVILRRDELKAELEAYRELGDISLAEWLAERKEELDALEVFCKGFEGYDADAYLIHECNVSDYIKEQFFERYANDETFDKLRAYIDMEKVVNDELSNYSQAKFGDVTFYYV